MDIPELKKQRFANFYLYDCEHIDNGAYPPAAVLPVGPHANIFVCKHCWIHVKNLALVELITDLIRHNPSPALQGMLSSLIAEMNENHSAESNTNGKG